MPTSNNWYEVQYLTPASVWKLWEKFEYVRDETGTPRVRARSKANVTLRRLLELSTDAHVRIIHATVEKELSTKENASDAP
jgi:hypothetical protein